MKIIVCVKQVPDTSGKVAVKADGTMDRASMATIINPDDLNATEAALSMKDDILRQNPEASVKVIVVTMGPAQASSMLHELLAMGADEAVLVSGREFGGSDTFATSQILAAAIRRIGMEPDTVIFCGRQAIDGDTAQVGPQIAEHLDLPHVSYAESVSLLEDGRLEIWRQFEDRYHILHVKLPCLITVLSEAFEPRYMSVGGIVTAYDDKEITVWNYDFLKDVVDPDNTGLKGSPTKVRRSFTKQAKGKGTLMKDLDSRAAVEAIMETLKAKHIIN